MSLEENIKLSVYYHLNYLNMQLLTTFGRLDYGGEVLQFLKESRPGSEEDRQKLIELFGERVARYTTVRREAETQYQKARKALKMVDEGLDLVELDLKPDTPGTGADVGQLPDVDSMCAE